MKITAGPAGAANKHLVKVEIWLTYEEAQSWPLTATPLATVLGNVDVCIKDHLLTGHRATRQVTPK